MARFGFCGGFYQALSLNADAQAAVNFLPEVMEADGSKSRLVMYGSPGTQLFATLPESPVRGQREINGRYFAVGGTKFCEISSAGVVTVWGSVVLDGNPASIAAGIGLLLIASGGHCYSFNLATNTFAEVDTTTGAAIQGPVLQVDFDDGYFFALLTDGRIQLSGLIATTFDPLDIAQVSVTPGQIIGMIVDHREVWLFGNKAIVQYSDTGNPLFPFELINGAFIEMGAAATFAQVKIDNTIFWINSDERGNGMGWRAEGYSPRRITTHAIENAWQGYSTISDAIGYAIQTNGHSIWVVYFPTAGKTWAYDVATGLWVELKTTRNGVEGAHCSQNHAFAFGKHLVGDWNSANIYQYGLQFLDDNGTNIRRVRRAPVVSTENIRIVHEELEFDIEPATGNMSLLDGDGNVRAPQIMVRWSDDSGHTWKSERLIDCGKPGEYQTRPRTRRLGQSRRRVYELSVTDAVPWRIIDAYLAADPGFPKTERLSAQLRKGA